MKCIVDARMDFVHIDAEGWLIVAYIAVKYSSFRIVAFYAPDDRDEHVSFFR